MDSIYRKGTGVREQRNEGGGGWLAGQIASICNAAKNWVSAMRRIPSELHPS